MYNRLRKEKKGFTLVEIIVVLVILAILAAFTIPAMLGYIESTRKTAVQQEGHIMLTAFRAAFTEEYASGITKETRKYYDSRDKSNSNFVITCWSFKPSNYADIHTEENKDSSNQIAKKIVEKYLQKDLTYCENGDYSGKSVKDAANNAGKNSAVLIIYNGFGVIKEFDYYHNGYMWQYKNGTYTTYSSADNAGFPKVGGQKGEGANRIGTISKGDWE